PTRPAASTAPRWRWTRAGRRPASRPPPPRPGARASGDPSLLYPGRRRRLLWRRRTSEHLGARGPRGRVLAPRQRRRDPPALRHGLVLAELRLALEASDAHLEAHDASQHPLPVPGGEPLPAGPVLVLVLRDELAEELLVRARVVHGPRPPVGVDGDVVPGRHALGRVVMGRRHVGVRAGEHDEYLAVLDPAPLRVRL